MLIILSLLNILSILTISLAPKNGALSFGFLIDDGVADLDDEVSTINLLNLLRRLYIGLT